MADNAGSKVTYFLVGLGVGALVGILFAPKSGEETREFLASKDPRKRDKLIDTLMASPEFVDYFTFRFSDLFRVSVDANGRSLKWSEMYSQWLRDSIGANKPYDQIARERRALPWERIEKDYLFDTPEGRRTLADLFEGRRQLLVQHFMFGPGWEQG